MREPYVIHFPDYTAGEGAVLRYEERLKECGLTTLETPRLREDQIELRSASENIDSDICYN